MMAREDKDFSLITVLKTSNLMLTVTGSNTIF